MKKLFIFIFFFVSIGAIADSFFYGEIRYIPREWSRPEIHSRGHVSGPIFIPSHATRFERYHSGTYFSHRVEAIRHHEPRVVIYRIWLNCGEQIVVEEMRPFIVEENRCRVLGVISGNLKIEYIDSGRIIYLSKYWLREK